MAGQVPEQRRRGTKHFLAPYPDKRIDGERVMRRPLDQRLAGRIAAHARCGHPIRLRTHGRLRGTLRA